jgi:hypothetical protein
VTAKKVPPGDDPDGTNEHDDDHASQSQCSPGDLIAKGKAIAESGKHLPPRGKHLGRIDYWGLDVYGGSPQEWIDALYAEDESC